MIRGRNGKSKIGISIVVSTLEAASSWSRGLLLEFLILEESYRRQVHFRAIVKRPDKRFVTACLISAVHTSGRFFRIAK